MWRTGVFLSFKVPSLKWEKSIRTRIEFAEAGLLHDCLLLLRVKKSNKNYDFLFVYKPVIFQDSFDLIFGKGKDMRSHNISNMNLQKTKFLKYWNSQYHATSEVITNKCFHSTLVNNLSHSLESLLISFSSFYQSYLTIKLFCTSSLSWTTKRATKTSKIVQKPKVICTNTFFRNLQTPSFRALFWNVMVLNDFTDYHTCDTVRYRYRGHYLVSVLLQAHTYVLFYHFPLGNHYTDQLIHMLRCYSIQVDDTFRIIRAIFYLQVYSKHKNDY